MFGNIVVFFIKRMEVLGRGSVGCYFSFEFCRGKWELEFRCWFGGKVWVFGVLGSWVGIFLGIESVICSYYWV